MVQWLVLASLVPARNYCVCVLRNLSHACPRVPTRFHNDMPPSVLNIGVWLPPMWTNEKWDPHRPNGLLSINILSIQETSKPNRLLVLCAAAKIPDCTTAECTVYSAVRTALSCLMRCQYNGMYLIGTKTRRRKFEKCRTKTIKLAYRAVHGPGSILLSVNDRFDQMGKPILVW